MIACVVVLEKANLTAEEMRQRDKAGRYSRTGGGGSATTKPPAKPPVTPPEKPKTPVQAKPPAKPPIGERITNLRTQIERHRGAGGRYGKKPADTPAQEQPAKPPPQAKPPPKPTTPPWHEAHPQGGKLPDEAFGTMTVKELEWHKRAFNHKDVPQAVIAAIRKAPSLRDVTRSADSPNSFYQPMRYADDGSILMREGYPDSAYEEAIWCHEYGHHLDHVIGETQRPDDLGKWDAYAGSAGDTPAMRDDGENLVQAAEDEDEYKKYQDHYQRIYREFDAAEDYHLKRLDYVANDETRYQQSERSALQDLLEAHGFARKDLDTVFGKNMIQSSAVIGCLAGLAAGHPQRAMSMNPTSKGMYACVGDMLSCVTRKRLKFASEHDDAYLNNGRATSVKGYTESHSTEAFANWFAVQGSKERFWRTFVEKLAPATHHAFTTRVNTWLTS